MCKIAHFYGLQTVRGVWVTVRGVWVTVRGVWVNMCGVCTIPCACMCVRSFYLNVSQTNYVYIYKHVINIKFGIVTIITIYLAFFNIFYYILINYYIYIQFIYKQTNIYIYIYIYMCILILFLSYNYILYYHTFLVSKLTRNSYF